MGVGEAGGSIILFAVPLAMGYIAMWWERRKERRGVGKGLRAHRIFGGWEYRKE